MVVEALPESLPQLPVALASNYEWLDEPNSKHLGGRIGVNLVRNINTGKVLVLKMATPEKPLDPDQAGLLDLTQETAMPAFRLPKLEQKGEDWLLMEYIEKNPMADSLDTEPEACIEATLRLALWYQTVLPRYHDKHGKRAISTNDRNWVFNRIQQWGNPMVQERLISTARLTEIVTAWQAILAHHGEAVFKHVHGNIHLDHILGKPHGTLVLTDPVDWIRACPFDAAIYDWLRSLDWMILKAQDPEKIFELVIQRIKAELGPNHDSVELKAFLALRGLGCIGGDMLQHYEDLPQESESKANIRLRTLLRLVNEDF